MSLYFNFILVNQEFEISCNSLKAFSSVIYTKDVVFDILLLSFFPNGKET